MLLWYSSNWTSKLAYPPSPPPTFPRFPMSGCCSQQDCKFLYCRPVEWIVWIGLHSTQHMLDIKTLSACAHFWIRGRVCMLGSLFYWNKANTKSLEVLHYTEIIQKVQVCFNCLVPQFLICGLLWSSLILFLLDMVTLLLFHWWFSATFIK